MSDFGNHDSKKMARDLEISFSDALKFLVRWRWVIGSAVGLTFVISILHLALKPTTYITELSFNAKLNVSDPIEEVKQDDIFDTLSVALNDRLLSKYFAEQYYNSLEELIAVGGEVAESAKKATNETFIETISKDGSKNSKIESFSNYLSRSLAVSLSSKNVSSSSLRLAIWPETNTRWMVRYISMEKGDSLGVTLATINAFNAFVDKYNEKAQTRMAADQQNKIKKALNYFERANSIYHSLVKESQTSKIQLKMNMYTVDYQLTQLSKQNSKSVKTSNYDSVKSDEVSLTDINITPNVFLNRPDQSTLNYVIIKDYDKLIKHFVALKEIGIFTETSSADYSRRIEELGRNLDNIIMDRMALDTHFWSVRDESSKNLSKLFWEHNTNYFMLQKIDTNTENGTLDSILDPKSETYQTSILQFESNDLRSKLKWVITPLLGMIFVFAFTVISCVLIDLVKKEFFSKSYDE